MNRNFVLYLLFQVFFLKNFNANCMSNEERNVSCIIKEIGSLQDKLDVLWQKSCDIRRGPRVVFSKKIKFGLLAFAATGFALGATEYSKTSTVEGVLPYLGILSFLMYCLTYFLDEYQERKILISHKKCWEEIIFLLDSYNQKIGLLNKEFANQKIVLNGAKKNGFLREKDQDELICYNIRFSVLGEIEESKQVSEKYLKTLEYFRTVYSCLK